MTRELLFKIINQQLFGQLLLIELVFLLSWLVILKLELRILEVCIEFKKILPCAVIGSLLNLFIKPFLPVPVAAFAQIALLVLFLKIYGKVRLILAFWAVFLSLMTIMIGSYLTQLLLCYWDQNISFFILNSEYGMILGTLAETMGPAILLHIISTFKFSVTFPLSRKPTKLDLIGVPAFGLMYSSIFNSCARLFFRYEKQS